MKMNKRIMAAAMCFAMLIQPCSISFVMADVQDETKTVSDDKQMDASKLSPELLEQVNSEAKNIRIGIWRTPVDEDEIEKRINEKIGLSEDIDLYRKARLEVLGEYFDEWRDEIFAEAGIDKTAVVAVSKYVSSTTCDVNADQVRKLSLIDSVQDIDYLDPTAEPLPTVSPTISPTAAPIITQQGVAYGDVNIDGIIDVSDLTMLSLALLGDNELSDSQKKNADVDSDSEITVADLARLRQYLSKKIVSFDDKTPSEPVKDPSADGYEFSVNYCTASNQIIGPQTEVFTSEKELNEYLEQNQDKMIRLNDEANYDAEWFENHNLVMVLLKEPYLDFGHEVTHVDSQKIEITRLKQRNVSPMEKGWAIFIELDKDSEMSSEKINVVITDKEVDSVSAYLQGKR